MSYKSPALGFDRMKAEPFLAGLEELWQRGAASSILNAARGLKEFVDQDTGLLAAKALFGRRRVEQARCFPIDLTDRLDRAWVQRHMATVLKEGVPTAAVFERVHFDEKHWASRFGTSLWPKTALDSPDSVWVIPTSDRIAKKLDFEQLPPKGQNGFVAMGAVVCRAMEWATQAQAKEHSLTAFEAVELAIKEGESLRERNTTRQLEAIISERAQDIT